MGRMLPRPLIGFNQLNYGQAIGVFSDRLPCPRVRHSL